MTYPRILAVVLLAAAIALSLNLPPAPVQASDSNLRTDVKTIYSSYTISANTTDTSTTQFTAIGQSKDMSIQVRGTPISGTANFTVKVKCSIDETNFVVPETGGTIGTFTDNNWHVAAVSVPFCKRVVLQVTNNTTDTAVDAILASQ